MDGSDDDSGESSGNWRVLEETEDPLAGSGPDEDPLALDCASESGESIIEVVVETCCLCREKFYSQEELTCHLALHHFQHGLLQELLGQGWEDGDLTCPKCGDLVSEGSVLLHWASYHGRVEALLRKCFHGGRCDLSRDKLSCHDYLSRQAGPSVNMFPNSQLARSFHEAELEEENLQEDNVIILDESESSGDEIEIVEIKKEIQKPQCSNKIEKQHIDASPRKSYINNQSIVNIELQNGNQPSETCEESKKNGTWDSDDDIMVETILEKITQPKTEIEPLNSNLLNNVTIDVKTENSNYAKDLVSSVPAITKLEDRREIQPGEESVRKGTVCKICSKSFHIRRDFTDHLAAEHFRGDLEREMVRAGGGGGTPTSCPTCSLFRSKDLTTLIVHYGARCKPFPVTKMYSGWLSNSDLGLSSDVCLFCGARAHSPNDLAFHLRDKHVADVLDKMGFNFFFKAQQKEEGGLEFSCPYCGKTEEELSKLCLHLMRQHETLFIELYQKFSRLGSQPVSCHICGSDCSSTGHLLSHLTSHFAPSLLSECGCSPDQMLACSSCSFVSRDPETLVSHYAREHHRLDFFFMESVQALVEEGKIHVSDYNLITETIRLDDFDRLLSLLRSTNPLEELSMRKALLHPESLVYKAMLEFIVTTEDRTEFHCPICYLKLPEERLMVSHLALNPHWKAKTQLEILAGRRRRLLLRAQCEDPVSSSINIRHDIYNNKVSITLQDFLHPTSLKPLRGLKNGPYSCYFCDILGEESVHGDLISFQLHLAEEHFSDQLQYYFLLGGEGSHHYRCQLCPSQVFSSLELLVTHLASHHDMIAALYEAALPPNSLPICDKTTKSPPPHRILLSSIFPWFPRGFPTVTILTTQSHSQSQCLECFEEFSSLPLLLDHMAQMEHMNPHWVAQTNQGQGRWFEKQHILRCRFCISAGGISPEFRTGRAVCLHILKSHREQFEIEYAQVTQDYVVCKICKYYIGFTSNLTEAEREKAELEHYLSHGVSFLSSLGLISSDSAAPHCSLCPESMPSPSRIIHHLQTSHQFEVLKRCREFKVEQLSLVPRPSHCPVCSSPDSSPSHLALHDETLLADLGLVDLRSKPKFLCKVCHSVSRDISRVIEHFSEEHSHLYNFLLSKYKDFTQKVPDEEPVCETELCELCGKEFPSQEFDSHLYMVHYQARVMALLGRYPLTCPYCDPQSEVLRPGLPSLIQHCIEDHQMVRKFYQEDTKSQGPPSRPAGGFESAFMKFVGSEGDKLVPQSSYKEIETRLPSRALATANQVKIKPVIKNNLTSAESCKICGKDFERTNSKGEVKSNSRLASDIKHHYTSHFRDKLIAKYPSSFSANPPLTCEKCGFESKSSSTNIHTMKQIMLSHVASCQGELEELIQNCERRVPQSKHPSDNNQHQLKVSSDWRDSASCLLCGFGLRDNTRKLHYVNHFKTELRDILKSIQIKNSCLACPFESCQKTISVNENLWEIAFFVHLGCDHNLFSKFILKRKKETLTNGLKIDSENNDFSCEKFNFSKDYKNCVTSLNERLWAIRAADCFVCGAKIQDVPRRSRVDHYQSHFTTLDQMLSSLCCCFCGVRKENRKELLQHILQQHIQDRMEQHMKTEGESLRCLYCPFKVSSLMKPQMVHHLANDEMLLEVEILKDVIQRQASSKTNISQPTKRAPTKTLSAFIKDLDENPLCVKCNIVGQSLESLMNHLVRKHYTSQVNSSLQENFNDFLIREQNQETVKCKLCGKTLFAKRPEVAHHWGVEHRKILQVYYQDCEASEGNTPERKEEIEIDKTDEDVEMENGNCLNTLYGDYDSDNNETFENRERENLFRIQKFLDKVRISKKVFVQVGPCYQIDPRLPPCHECKKIQTGVATVDSGTCCCFEGFRKLKYSTNTTVQVCGYLDPVRDPRQGDLDIWSAEKVRGDMSEDLAVFILGWVGDLLCNLVYEETQLKQNYRDRGRELIWRRAHEKVREMCDVCSTTIFNLHWTCGSCSVMVCPDCYKARRSGTKYRSVANLARPYRTRKRLGWADKDLDSVLWPLCTGGKIHSLDKLLLTQMSPGNLPEVTVETLHQIRKHFNLPSNCNCCRRPDVSSLLYKDQLSSEFSIESCSTCLFCPLSFRELSVQCRALHLGFHLREKILAKSEMTGQCEDCEVRLLDHNSMFLHKVLVHRAVEKYLDGEFIKKEAEKQWNCRLEIDENLVCEICGCNLNTDKLGRRGHYIKHLEKLLQEDLPLSAPYRCKDCGHVEISRSRLVVHTAVVHRRLDLCLQKYLQSQEVSKQKEEDGDWTDLQFCVRCQESFDGHSLSVRRLHYVRHFREQLEDSINAQYNQLLLRDPPYKCYEQGCDFASSEKSIFINHVGGKHRQVDVFIQAELSSGPKQEDRPAESPYSRCTVCEVKFEAEENKRSIHHHYFDHLQENNLPKIPKVKLPLCCPFPKCAFKTDNVKSDDRVHHEKHLVYHIGSQHQLFSQLARDSEKIIFFKNSQNYLNDSQCKICGKDFSRSTRMKVRNHYHRHVKPWLIRDYCGEDVSKCPLCGYHVGGDKDLLSLHLGSSHGLLDHYISLLSCPLDYSLPGCLVCPHEFREEDRISEQNLHYTSHFLAELTREHQLNPRADGSVQCGLCANIFPSLHLSVMHIGSQHGGFHKLIQKIICNQDELDLDISEPIWHSITDNTIASQCGICGEKFYMEKTLNDDEIKSLLRKHLDNHLGQTNFMVENQITKTLIGLDHSEVKSFMDFFLPLKKDNVDYWLDNNSVKASKSILNGFIDHRSEEMTKTKSTGKRKYELSDLQQVKKLKTEGENGEPPRQKYPANSSVNSLSQSMLGSFIESLTSEDSELSDDEGDDSMQSLIKSFSDKKDPDGRTGLSAGTGLDCLAPRHVLTKQESLLISEAEHSWLCDGSLLKLDDAISPHNMKLFQSQWARGQPVIISNSNEYLDYKLWHPKAFCKDFGHLRADLVNTLTGKTVPKQPLKWFWEGFEKVSCRPLDSDGTPMLLKLKDWPPEDDIAKYIPRRFHNLVHDFPIQPYTLREGNCNLASYIPDNFLRPELGPKMYIAYGNALYSNKASTNLHLDMSDAVNLLVYVGIPSDTSNEENIRLVLEQIDEAGCDLSMKNRVRSEGKLPGALWHIYHPGDTAKIRDLLTKVAIENRRRLDPHDDPIHDQSTYLDANLRRRLYSEYGVKGYPIVQCSGDTVFIPAGACHQVRNLHNCIKIAEDFVSPELAHNCLHLTQEFRHLTEHHTNHEDKLQIKNIIYHSTKTAVARLKQIMENKNA